MANRYGWVGVELFFLISSFLFFHLLDVEHQQTDRISISNFFIRRFLRIYPLMLMFPLAMLAIYGSPDHLGWFRLAGIALLIDNAVAWFKGYDLSIPYTAHLWTLSFEFQTYLFTPFVFLAYRRYGKAVFLGAVCAVFTYCFLARMTVFNLGAAHPIIWVTPFLRPESILMGMALYVVHPKWHWGYSITCALVAGTAFLSLPPPWMSPLGSAFSYPLAALMCGGLVDAGLRAPLLSAVLSFRPLTYLGQISFGLYVYHYLFVALTVPRLAQIQGPLDPSGNSGDYWLLFATAITFTIGMATISYFGLEIWIDRYKQRFAVVEGRPGYTSSRLHGDPVSAVND